MFSRSPRRRSFALAVVLVVLTSLLAGTGISSGRVNERKTFEATVTPTTPRGGVGQAFLFEVKNTSTNNVDLGSLQFTMPAGLTLLDAYGTGPSAGSAQLFLGTDASRIDVVPDLTNRRSADTGQFVLVVQRDASLSDGLCIPTVLGIKVEAKQSNDFQGTGNDLTLTNGIADGRVIVSVDEGCELRFASQPGSAVDGQTVVSDGGGPVRVEVVDSNQQRLTGLSGQVNVALLDGGDAELTSGDFAQLTGGVADLAPVVTLGASPSATVRLQASFGSLTPVASQPFDVEGLALEFVTQPANAYDGQTVTSEPLDAAGPPVRVQVVDSSGTPKSDVIGDLTVELLSSATTSTAKLTGDEAELTNGAADLAPIVDVGPGAVEELRLRVRLGNRTVTSESFVVEGFALRFVDQRQPSDAYDAQPITSAPLDPDGAPVEVEVVGAASGARVAVDGSVAVAVVPSDVGTPTPLSAPLVAGLAVLSTSVDVPDLSFTRLRLDATATVPSAVLTVSSEPFVVSGFDDVTTIVDCTDDLDSVLPPGDEIDPDPAAGLDCQGAIGGLTVQTSGDKIFGLGDLTGADGTPTFAVRFPDDALGGTGTTPVYARYVDAGPVSPWAALEASAEIQYPGGSFTEITALCGIDYRDFLRTPAGAAADPAPLNSLGQDDYEDPCADIAYDDDTFSLEYVVRFLADPTFRFR